MKAAGGGVGEPERTELTPGDDSVLGPRQVPGSDDRRLKLLAVIAHKKPSIAWFHPPLAVIRFSGPEAPALEWPPVAEQRDYSHRTAIEKLGIAEDERLEVAGDVGTDLRRGLKEAVGRGFVRSGELDGAVVCVESIEEAEAALERYRSRLRDSGYLWMVTRKRGLEGHVNQVQLVPLAKRAGLIDNKTCSLDGERSAIRFVVPRALRGAARDAA